MIKDSVSVKTAAFFELFKPYGLDIAKRVKKHHELNGGMSRYEKFPLYLKWTGEEVTETLLLEFCERFRQMVVQGVIDSPWVPGAEEYLRANSYQQKFILVSATPQEELMQILQTLDIQNCFEAIFGSPMSKTEAIKKIINLHNIPPEYCLMIGDARADMEAAENNNISFLLKRHATNFDAFVDYDGHSIERINEL